MSSYAVQPQSMFNTALPYGAITLGVGVVGAITAVAATSTIGMIMGIVLGILGGYAFCGVVTCGLASRTSDDFHQNIWTHMATAAGAGIATMIQFTIQIVIARVIDGIFNRRRA